MRSMIICPNCQDLANYDYHFQKYFCTRCDWSGLPKDEGIYNSNTETEDNMHLAELLMDRKDLVSQINRLKEDALKGAVTRSDMTPPYNISDKLQQYEELMRRLREINVKIDKANAEHMTDLLNELRIIDSRLEFYKSLRNVLLAGGEHYYGGEIERVINHDVEDVSTVISTLEKKRRTFDRQIQKKNWQVEVE